MDFLSIGNISGFEQILKEINGSFKQGMIKMAEIQVKSPERVVFAIRCIWLNKTRTFQITLVSMCRNDTELRKLGTKSTLSILSAHSCALPCLCFSFSVNEHGLSSECWEQKNANCPLPMEQQKWDNPCEAGTAAPLTGSIYPEHAAVHVPLPVPEAKPTMIPQWLSFENTSMNFELVNWQFHHRTVSTAGRFGFEYLLSTRVEKKSTGSYSTA